MKTLSTSSATLFAAFAMLGLAGCASKDIIACPPITAPEEAAEAFITTDKSGYLVDVRFNGVSAVCTLKRNGNTQVAVKAGLKARRSLSQGEEADVALVPMAAAIIGPDETVLSTKEFGYRIGFAKGKSLNYPVAEFDFELKSDERLVIMLTPTL